MNDAAILNVFAIAYLAIGIGGMVEPAMFKNLLRDFEKDRAVSFVSGLFAITVGYVIGSTHVHAETPSAILVAALGWIALVKGFVLIAAPKWTFDMADRIMKGRVFAKTFPYVLVAVSFVIFYFTLGR